jgi:cobalt/nickel transport system permease protein
MLSRTSPWTKLILLIVIILVLTSAKSVVLLAALYIFTLALYWHSGLPLRNLFNWYLLPVLFVLSLIILLIWNEPGGQLISLHNPWFSLTLTDGGLLLVIRLLLKTLISMTASLLLLMTTRYAHISAMIYKIFPSPIDQIFLMSYRFLFVTLSMVDSIIRAFKSRGGGFMKSMRRHSRTFAEIFALVFIRSYDRAERVSKAMESRGYNGTYIAATEVQTIGAKDYIILLMAFSIAAYLLLINSSLI